MRNVRRKSVRKPIRRKKRKNRSLEFVKRFFYSITFVIAFVNTVSLFSFKTYGNIIMFDWNVYYLSILIQSWYIYGFCDTIVNK